MLYLGSSGSKLPSKLDLRPLHEMAGNFQMTDIRWMAARRDIIVLENALCVEVMHVPILFEMLVYLLNFGFIDGFLHPG